MDQPFEPEAFARTFHQFLETMNALAPQATSAFPRLLRDHLGVEPDGLPVVGERLPSSELPNLQLVLDELAAAGPARTLGLPPETRHNGGFSLGTLTSQRRWCPEPVAVELVDVPVGPDESLPCLQTAVFLGRLDGRPFALLVIADDQRLRAGPGLTLQLTAPDLDTARDVLDHLRRRRRQRNVYRGRVVRVLPDGTFRFVAVPPIRREDVVLPEEDLAAMEQHTLGISARAEALRASGRHLKRGLLLYGPPGTGKTYSVMYLCSRMPERTVVLIDGPGIMALGPAVETAKLLAPSMVVLEDVDLVAHDRTMPGVPTQPLLFQLLNQMDGVGEDRDVVFVLTTNRVDLLEPALAQRPGRIDQAVEIRLPDEACRRRLLLRYLEGVDHDVADVSPLVARTEGASAAFIRELVRRAVLRATEPGALGAVVGDRHLREALDDLRLHRAPVVHAALGAVPPVP